jgi:CII-binding regulator of phage lambda lysogenization HflD
MKKFLLLYVILIGSNLETKSQITDTLCFPIAAVQKLLIDAKQKKYADSLVSVYRSDISFLNQKIQALETKDSTNKEINSTYQNMIGTMNQQRTILEGQITYLNKEVKKWKRKTRLAGIAGITLTAIVTGLFLFK